MFQTNGTNIYGYNAYYQNKISFDGIEETSYCVVKRPANNLAAYVRGDERHS